LVKHPGDEVLPSTAPRAASKHMTEEPGFDEEILTTALSDFAHSLASGFEISEVLYRLAEHVTEILHVAGAGVSLVDASKRLRRVTVVNELTDRLESVEEARQEGPCVDAFHDGRVIVVPDLGTAAGSWPRWSAEAQRLGIKAVLGIPLRARGKLLGAMNVYNSSVRSWRASEIRVAQVLADMAAGYVSTASELELSRRTAEQLQEALDSRIVIEQAKGVLAAERHISVAEAFVVLREHARDNGAALKAVADAVVNLGLRPARSRRNRPTG
jgi:GAF domain-containing protein